MVSLTALATRAPIVVCPAMDAQMFEHAATQGHIEVLRSRGVTRYRPGGRAAGVGAAWGAGDFPRLRAIIGGIRHVLGADR